MKRIYITNTFEPIKWYYQYVILLFVRKRIFVFKEKESITTIQYKRLKGVNYILNIDIKLKD